MKLESFNTNDTWKFNFTIEFGRIKENICISCKCEKKGNLRIFEQCEIIFKLPQKCKMKKRKKKERKIELETNVRCFLKENWRKKFCKC